jgi:hypothetical protein
MYSVPSFVKPESKDDRERWAEQSLRYRMLTGAHIEDLRDELRRLFAREISADLEFHPDMSRNPLRMIVQQLANAYAEAPHVEIVDPDADLSPIISPRLWALQQQTELLTLGINEAVMRLDWPYWAGAERVSYRTVSPDLVVMRADPMMPDQPIAVEELRARTNTKTGDSVWTWEVWDISDRANPTFRIDAVDDRGSRRDATAEYAPDLVGGYPYTGPAGPILPYVLYHSIVGGSLWNYRGGTEMVRGSLRLAALWSHWCDGYQNCSHPQRIALDVDTQAGITKNIGGVSVDVVPIDRKSILKFRSTGPGGGSITSLTPAMEPKSAAEALRVYETGLAVYAGLNPSDLMISQAQSGYSIVVSRAGMRRRMRAVEPAFRMSDQLLMSRAAMLSNAYGGSSLPMEPEAYTIRYRGVSDSPEEIKQRAELVRTELDTDEKAIERLLRIDRLAQLLNTPPAEAKSTE